MADAPPHPAVVTQTLERAHTMPKVVAHLLAPTGG